MLILRAASVNVNMARSQNSQKRPARMKPATPHRRRAAIEKRRVLPHWYGSQDFWAHLGRNSSQGRAFVGCYIDAGMVVGSE